MLHHLLFCFNKELIHKKKIIKSFISTVRFGCQEKDNNSKNKHTVDGLGWIRLSTLSFVTILISLFAIKLYVTRKLCNQQYHNNQQQQDQQQDQRRKEKNHLYDNTGNNNNNIFSNKKNNSNTNTENTTENTNDKEEAKYITINNNKVLSCLFQSISINNSQAAFFFSYLCLFVSLSIIFFLCCCFKFLLIGATEALMVLSEIAIFTAIHAAVSCQYFICSYQCVFCSMSISRRNIWIILSRVS